MKTQNIGRWIDALGDTERDNIVQGQMWFGGGEGEGPPADTRCLMMHAADTWSHVYGIPVGKTPQGVTIIEIHPIARRFDRLCNRVGLSEAKRLVKARAGAEITQEIQEVAHAG